MLPFLTDLFLLSKIMVSNLIFRLVFDTYINVVYSVAIIGIILFCV